MNLKSPTVALCRLLAAAGLFSAVCERIVADDTPTAEQFFSREVLPLLREHCFECHSHGSGEASGNLMLDSMAGITVGGTRGGAIEPRRPGRSLLLSAVRYDDIELQMPPSGKLTDESIEVFRRWIADGAVMTDALRRSSAPVPQAASSHNSTTELHWAYQRPRRASATLDSCGQATNALDAIIFRNLRTAGLTLSPRASRETLIRRLSYDLIGLPPSREEILHFSSDPRDDEAAIADLVDRLLSSPHFGERWARYWMDVARYADTKGYVFREDREYAEAFRYRDWLVDAFNDDLPYDQFVTRQLAADLMPGERDSTADHRDLPALGFLTLGRRFLNNKHDIIDDRMDVVSRGLMGMTLSCARCHDHKYDPISQADYYAMFGVFLNTDEPGGEPWPHRLVDSGEDRDSFILIRGSPGNRGDKVQRRFVGFLAPGQSPFSGGSGRVELAARIVSPENPLTARVMANRIWLHLTGSSLVESPSDFGLRSPPPKQSELLDHLAIELIEGQWSIKRLIRSVVCSQVYQQQSFHRPDCHVVEPENALYWKMNRRRLDFESLRDTLLLRSGLLDTQTHGKSEQIDTPPFSHRRTLYAYIDRQNLPNVFRTFDLASPDTHVPIRSQTSVPQQGLYLLNSDFVAELAVHLGNRAIHISTDPAEQVSWLFEQVLGRLPANEELELMTCFMDSQPPMTAGDDEAESEKSRSGRWAQLAGALLATNELAYID